MRSVVRLSAAAQKLVEDHYNLAWKYARKYQRMGWANGLTVEDLVSAGHLALVDVARYYKPESGFAFATPAIKVIKRYIREEVDKNRRRKGETRGYYVISLDALLNSERMKTQEHHNTKLTYADTFSYLQDLTDIDYIDFVESLTLMDQTILSLRMQDYSFREIADMYGQKSINFAQRRMIKIREKFISEGLHEAYPSLQQKAGRKRISKPRS
jgi:RNA polymerase sigma factor (sigma-70 family)